MRQRFESVRVTVDGRPRPLVDGTRIVLTVQEDPGDPDGPTVSARAGCNSMSVRGGIRDGRLVGQVAMTLKSCGPERDEQDRWLGTVLASGPRWERDGDGLRLVSGGTTIELTAVRDG